MEGSQIPELPNFITLIHRKFHGAPWAEFLHDWENIIFSFLISMVIALFFYLGTRKMTFLPSGLQNFLEWIVENFRHIVHEILGKRGEKYVPFLGTLFVYILAMNLFGLVPFMKSPSSNLNITIGLALCVFAQVQYLNIKHMGIGGFLYHLAGDPKDALGWAMAPLLFFVELLTQLSRPVTLSLRLFGNVLGEDVLIGAFALFGVLMLANYNYNIGLPLQIPFVILAILLSFMQALVFTLLSTIYILLTMHGTEKKH